MLLETPISTLPSLNNEESDGSQALTGDIHVHFREILPSFSKRRKVILAVLE